MKTTALLAAFAAATAAATCPNLTSQLEDLGDGALPMKESSGTSSDFATKGGTVAYGAKGAVGGAVDFSQATTKNYLMAADDDDLDGFADFTIADEAAFSNAVVAAGADGLVVARANWVFGDSELVNGTKVVVPQPSAGMAHRWKMAVGDGGTTLRLRFAAPASGYAAWMATKFTTDGLWRPTASESSGYVFPSQMFFKYMIEIQE